MKKNIEIIIGVIASRGNLYDILVKEYWQHIINYANKNYNGKIKIYLMYGKEFDKNYFNYLNEKNLFICDYRDSLRPGILKKTVDFMKYIDKNYNYKQLFRTNLSSFLVLNNMLEVSKTLDTSNNYIGSIIYNEIIKWDKSVKEYIKNFASGCGFWLSNDLVKYIINNEVYINYNMFDDVEIAKILENIQEPKELYCIEIAYYTSVRYGMNRLDVKNSKISHLNELFNKTIDLIKNNKKNYHIRVKIRKNNNIDLFFIKKLTEKYYK